MNVCEIAFGSLSSTPTVRYVALRRFRRVSSRLTWSVAIAGTSCGRAAPNIIVFSRAAPQRKEMQQKVKGLPHHPFVYK